MGLINWYKQAQIGGGRYLILSTKRWISFISLN